MTSLGRSPKPVTLPRLGSRCAMSTFDPLVSGFEDPTPPWPTTPHTPNQHIPNLRRASPAPPPLDSGPAPGLYGKEPKIYGQQEPGLVSPKDSVASNGQKPEPYLRIRITWMDRNRRDILVRLDAQVRNPPYSCGTRSQVQVIL